LCPEKFPVVVSSVRELCGWSAEKHSCAIPSLALKLGHSVKKCAMIVKADSIITLDDSRRKKVDDFFSLCSLEWNDDVSSTALETLKTAKMNKPQRLPLTEDLQKLSKMLNETIVSKSMSLLETVNVTTWYELAEATLAKFILFNRKRSGEAERLLVETYSNRNRDTTPDTDIFNSLSASEKLMCSTLERIEIRGKFGRTVPVILPPELVGALDLLVKYRDAVNVNRNNPFLFARPYFNSISCLRGSDCLRKFANTCNAVCPENITSTRLRKHVATVSQILNLGKNELDLLAQFMGHDVRVHRSYYRLPDDTLQLAKISKILVALDRGQMSTFTGQSLEEMTIDPEG
jgi:hypothetical protein